MDCKEAFKRQYRIEGEDPDEYLLRDDDGTYIDERVEDDWELWQHSWQASRQALEGESRPSLGQRKAAQVGETIGVLVQNQQGEVCAVTDMGRCTWLNQDVTGAGDEVSVPDGYALVPEKMTLDFEAIEMIRCMTGEGATEDEFSECVLWVGETVDDDGKASGHGLNIACNECLEEGSIPVIEFANPVVTGAGDGVSVPDNEYVRALQDAFDIIQADANTERNYGSLCRMGWVLANIKAKQEQGHE